MFPRRPRDRGRWVWVPRWWLHAAAVSVPGWVGLGMALGWLLAPPAGVLHRPPSPEVASTEASSTESPGPDAQGGGPAGPSPAGPSPAGPSPAGPSPAGPSPAGPSPTGTVAVGGSPDSTRTGTATAAAAALAPEPEIERAPPRGGYGLQVAAFPTEAEALEFVRAHADAMPRPFYVLEQPIRGERWYRVRVGRFDRASEADAARTTLPSALGAAALRVRYR